MKPRKGWAIKILRQDGSSFFASSGVGESPALWCERNRKWAVSHKKELIKEGFNCKVVEVKYSDPTEERLEGKLNEQ